MERLDISVATNGGIPIACDMAAIAASDRPAHEQASAELMSACVGFEEEPDAVRLRYPARPELLATVGRWMGLERQCCAFLDFALLAPAGSAEFELRIGGGEGAKAFVLANMVPERSPGD
jgi:hypothetical protein